MEVSQEESATTNVGGMVFHYSRASGQEKDGDQDAVQEDRMDMIPETIGDEKEIGSANGKEGEVADPTDSEMPALGATGEECIDAVPSMQANFELYIPFEELTKENDFRDHCLGGGSFGDVYKALHERHGHVAVKLARNGQKNMETYKKEIRKHIDAMRSNYIVSIKGFLQCDEHNLFGIVMEYMELGSLWHFRTERLKNVPPWPSAIKMVHEMSLGMKFLHSKNIIHRDLKLENVLIAQNFSVKIADLGLATNLVTSDGAQNNCGTLSHQPPEVFKEDASVRVTKKYDVYSFAMSIYEFLTGVHPYADRGFKMMGRLKLKDKTPPLDPIPHDTPDELKKIMEEGWSFDARDRPDFTKIADRLSRVLPKDTEYFSSLGYLGNQLAESKSSTGSGLEDGGMSKGSPQPNTENLSNKEESLTREMGNLTVTDQTSIAKSLCSSEKPEPVDVPVDRDVVHPGKASYPEPPCTAQKEPVVLTQPQGNRWWEAGRHELSIPSHSGDEMLSGAGSRNLDVGDPTMPSGGTSPAIQPLKSFRGKYTSGIEQETEVVNHSWEGAGRALGREGRGEGEGARAGGGAGSGGGREGEGKTTVTVPASEGMLPHTGLVHQHQEPSIRLTEEASTPHERRPIPVDNNHGRSEYTLWPSSTSPTGKSGTGPIATHPGTLPAQPASCEEDSIIAFDSPSANDDCFDIHLQVQLKLPQLTPAVLLQISNRLNQIVLLLQRCKQRNWWTVNRNTSVLSAVFSSHDITLLKLKLPWPSEKEEYTLILRVGDAAALDRLRSLHTGNKLSGLLMPYFADRDLLDLCKPITPEFSIQSWEDQYEKGRAHFEKKTKKEDLAPSQYPKKKSRYANHKKKTKPPTTIQENASGGLDIKAGNVSLNLKSMPNNIQIGDQTHTHYHYPVAGKVATAGVGAPSSSPQSRPSTKPKLCESAEKVAKKTIMAVSEEIPERGIKPLGRHLELKDTRVGNILYTYRDDTSSERAYQVMTEWMQQNGRSATKKKLANALWEAHCYDAARIVK